MHVTHGGPTVGLAPDAGAGTRLTRDQFMAALKERKPGDPNPFVVGQDSVQRFLTVLGECALATKAYVEAGQPGKQ